MLLIGKVVFRIKKKSQKPIHVQLEEQIQLAIHTGQLPPEGRLPTIRALAIELQVNANTVARVYRDLQDKGYLVLERGVGTFVAAEQPESPLARTDLRKVRRKTKQLVSLCQKIGLSIGELNQLAEEVWKELARE